MRRRNGDVERYVVEWLVVMGWGEEETHICRTDVAGVLGRQPRWFQVDPKMVFSEACPGSQVLQEVEHGVSDGVGQGGLRCCGTREQMVALWVKARFGGAGAAAP